MILVSATVGGYLLVFSALHTLYVNRKFFTARNTNSVVEANWIGVVRRVLLNLRDDHCFPKSAYTLHFPDFRVGKARL